MKTFLWIPVSLYAVLSVVASLIFFFKVSPLDLRGISVLISYILVGNSVFALVSALGILIREKNANGGVFYRRFSKSIRQGLLLGTLASTGLFFAHKGILNLLTTVLLVVMFVIIESVFASARPKETMIPHI